MISFIIDIDHLVDNISEFLFRKELFNCSLVSKQWSIAFNPVLWRRVDTERMKRDSFAAMSRHSHNVRSIIVHYDYVHSIFQPFFPNLRTLKFPISPSIHQRGVSIRTITYFLQSLPSVKRLKLNFDSMAGFYSGFEDLLCALETHPNIDQLDIRFMTKIFGESILRLIQTCRRYKSINVLFGPRTSINDWREMRFDNKAIPQVVQYQDTKLRELTIPLGLFEESEKIVKILGYCPMLERLDISSLSGNDTVKAVCEHLPKCTLLNHLRISNGGRNSEKVIAEVIQSIGRDGGKHGQIRLKSFLAPHCPISEFDGQLLKSLIKLFSGVMTTIEIGDMAPRCLSLLVTGLPRLKSLTASVSIGRDHNDIPFQKIDTASWSCKELEKLNITIILHGYMKPIDNSWDDSFEGKNTAHIFTQIGRLYQLQELNIQCREGLLYTYLSNFSELKRLRVFNACYTRLCTQGEPEAVWMYESWPRLGSVASRVYTLQKIKSQIEEILK